MTNLQGIDSENLLIALGRTSGYDRRSAFGYHDGLSSGTTVVVGTTGSEIAWPTTASTLNVVSTSVNDTPTGTGMGSILILGLDGSFNQVVEVISLNGTTPVVTANSYLRVEFFTGQEAGTAAGYNTATPDGAVTGTHNTDSEVLATILAGSGSGLTCAATVPAGKKLVLDTLTTHVDVGGTDVRFFIVIRNNTNPIATPYLNVSRTKLAKLSGGDFNLQNIEGSTSVLSEFADVWIEAEATGGGSADIASTLLYHLVDDV